MAPVEPKAARCVWNTILIPILGVASIMPVARAANVIRQLTHKMAPKPIAVPMIPAAQQVSVVGPVVIVKRITLSLVQQAVSV